MTGGINTKKNLDHANVSHSGRKKTARGIPETILEHWQKVPANFLLTQTLPTACSYQGASLPGRTEALRHCSPFYLHPALPSTGDLKTQQAQSTGTRELFRKPILRSCHSWPVQLLPWNAALCLPTFDLTQVARTGSAPSKTNTQPS